MAREKKVVDASIVAKWFVTEKDTEQALQLRQDHLTGKALLIVPELLFSEVLNILRYKGHGQKVLEEANASLWEIQLHIEHTNTFLLQRAISLALQFKLSLYDALYAALSQIHGCPLVTADEKLRKYPLSVPLL